MAGDSRALSTRARPSEWLATSWEKPSSTMAQRVGTPRDVARAVKFLILDAPYVTGQVINIDGGRSAHLSSPES